MTRFMKNTLFIIVLFIVSVQIANSQYDKSSIYDALNKKFGKLQSVSLKFSSSENREMTGSLKALRGNKYVLQIGQRTIVSNGKIITNYDKSENKVVISNYETTNATSIDEFFFSFIESYQPSNLIRETKSDKGFNYILEITPVDKSKKIKDIDYAKLWLNQNTLEIIRLQLFNTSGFHEWTISNLKLNPKFSDNTFEFKIPKGAEVIDLK